MDLVEKMAKILEIKDFFVFWPKIQASILHMATLLKREDLNYTFDPNLMPVGAAFYHIAGTYDGWFTYQIQDGEEFPKPVPNEDLTVEIILDALKKAFERCNRFLENVSRNDWDKEVTDYDEENKPIKIPQWWVLWHLIEHDIHHRTQLKLQFKYLQKEIDRKIYWEEM